MGGRGRRRRNVPNVSQRVVGTTPGLRPNSLPSQYNFTPAVQVPPTQSPQVPPANLQDLCVDLLYLVLWWVMNLKYMDLLFTRDHGNALVRKITKVWTGKFDAPYYSFTLVHVDRRERYFLEFAKTHHWDPLITGTVQYYFEDICQRRMKDMVSGARTSRERPPWIGDTLWETMCTYWDTEEAKKRSETYSKARKSDRGGLGPHVHFSGPKSFQQIKDEMEEQLGRAVSLGEVFIKTHTRPDGTYVDRKAEKIATTYQQNLELRLSQLEADASSVSDGESRPRELTAEDCTTIFLQSTEIDSRGIPYGIGSLKETLDKRKCYGQSSSSSTSFLDLQEQLKEAQRKIEEQAAYNEKRDLEEAARKAEQTRVAAEQKEKLAHLSLVEKYLRQTDPHFLDFMATHSAPQETTDPLSPLPQNDP
ncbi:putative transposase Ptta/En/Spm plant [Arabidopsis thaliana x Arabidopsis arenosa]|uniref:Putative transposase Ptta/En/Spm plant n=1 Tax=Arabidopsis thaliana x Arabidopsis arenosa TaxID=1240361 RepID=A0A8T2AWK7_9BRAS|nr:putative transposase Ptta/En/Spm plant [Arabidopsis thaliana x Arabidopsis arenosa]